MDTDNQDMDDGRSHPAVKVRAIYSVSQKKIPPDFFLTFSSNSWEFLVQILHAYYTFLSTLDYKFLLNYLQL